MPWWIRVGAFAMLVDLLLLITHGLHHLGDKTGAPDSVEYVFESAAVWNGGRDGSLIELFGQAQLGAAGLLLIFMRMSTTRHRIFAVWGCVFLVITADDVLMLHERAGNLLHLDRLAPSLTGSDPQALGGLVFWLVAATALGSWLLVAYRASPPYDRHGSATLIVTVAPMAIVGVVYVLLSAFHPAALGGPGGVVVVIRMMVKLLTMTMVLIQAIRLFSGRP
ncbi:hypothetical protein [Kocuria arenosa]|uniref:hypothetical protein n=1 Tax=Kocuria arenosa TaxID=3071446 RepID=UPI0034D70A87